MTTFLETPVATVGTPITAFAGSDAAPTPGLREQLLRTECRTFRQEFAATGTPDYVGTFDLVTLPYPTRFGLWRAALSPAPYLMITNRLLVIRWQEDGRTRTLLFEPSDVEADENTPYFVALKAKTPDVVRNRLVKRHGDVLDILARLRIAPEDVDYIVFDHLHTQDVRRWLGTTRPQPDVSPDRPMTAALPNAKLIVQRDELVAMEALSPLQQPWYQPESFRDLPPESVLAIDGDVLLGPGVALLSTPGHTIGNQSLALNTSSGIWVSSENAIAVEAMTPEHSKIPGVARWARDWGQEVVLNANTIEFAGDQYASMIKEKLIADTSSRDSRFLQFFPSSELTRSWAAPGVKPTFVHGGIRHGKLSG